MPVSTRWSDTHPAAMEVFLKLQRQRSPGQKLADAFELIELVMQLSAAGVRRRHPEAGEREVFLRTASLRLSRDLMMRAYGWHPDLGTPPL